MTRFTMRNLTAVFLSSRLAGYVLFLAAFLFAVSDARAALDIGGDLPPGLSIHISGRAGAGMPAHVELPDPPGFEIAGQKGKWRWEGTDIKPGRWELEWEIEGDPDPFLGVVISLHNTMPIEQDISVVTKLFVTPLTMDTLMGGSVSLNLIDFSFNSGGPPTAKTNNAGDPMYVARVDGVQQATLLDAPQSFVGVENGTLGFGSVDFGVPIPNVSGPSVITSDMEIEINARVSPGDTVSFVATFAIEPVPEPSTMALCITGVIGLLCVRRRRRSR